MKLVLADDHRITRELLRRVSTAELGHEVVAEAADGFQALESIGELRPDLVLLDLQLPRLDGFGVIEEVRRWPRRPRIIVLSALCNAYTVYRVERLPVEGFLDKHTATVEALREAVEAVDRGRRYFSEEFQRVRAARRADPWAFDKVLSDREQTVLALIGDWLTDREIAARLGLEPCTAEKHRFNIQRKLDLRTKTELVRYASRQGFRQFGACGT